MVNLRYTCCIPLVLLFGTCARQTPSGRPSSPAQTVHGIDEKRQRAHVAILGGAHNHIGNHVYSYEHVEDIVEKFEADVLAIEIPTNWFNKDGVPNSRSLEFLNQEPPIGEMNALWRYAKSHNLPIHPFDIENRNQHYSETDYFAKEKRVGAVISKVLRKSYQVTFDAREKLLRAKQECAIAKAEVMNSSRCDTVVQAEHEFRTTVNQQLLDDGALEGIKDNTFFIDAEEFWGSRTTAMAESICALAKKYPGRRLLVAVGFEHRYDLVPAVRKCEAAVLEDPWTTAE